MDEVTPEWLTSALRGRWPEITVRSVKNVSLGDGIGQMSELSLLELDHEGADAAPQSMVLKLHTAHPDMRAVAERYHMFEREVNFYQRFADKVPLRTPDVYFSGLAGMDRCVFLMEDMSGWHSPDQLVGPTLAQTEIAVQHLAKLTAAFWDSDVLEAESDWLPDFNVDYMRAIAQDYRDCLPEFLSRYGSALPEGADKAAHAIADRLDPLLDFLDTGPRVLTHYDYRVENMFFSKQEPLDFCVIDWQLIIRSRPGWDLAYLLGTNLPVDFRRQHTKQLENQYFEALAAGGVDAYARSDFDLDLARNMMAMTMTPVIGGANSDMSNPRNVDLFAAIGARSLTAVLDGHCLDLLP